MSCKALGKPPKSWIVGGWAWVSTSVDPGVCQCAETDRIAAGRGSSAPQVRSRRVNALSEMAFMGLPCPTKITGMRPGLLPVAANAVSVVADRAARTEAAEARETNRRRVGKRGPGMRSEQGCNG